MPSTPQSLPNEEETPDSTPKFRPSSRRNPSFSSSSRSNSWDSFLESPIFSPLHSPITPLKLTGVPFSWEQSPGIPKYRNGFSKNEKPGRRLLPLPPASTTTKGRIQEEISPKKHLTKRDPFFAALIKCSKDDHDQDQDHDYDHHGTNIWKGSLSERFGIINMYASCKKTCAVSESLVHVRRGGPHYLLHDHRRQSSCVESSLITNS